MEAGPRARGGEIRRPARAYAAVILTVAMWGYSAVAIKAVGASGIVVAFYRLWFAIPLLWLSLLLFPRLRGPLDRKWFLGCLAGGALFGFHQLLFFNAMKVTSVANVTIIGALQPVLVLLVAGPLFGEYLHRVAIGWSSVALAGTALVVLGGAASTAVSLEGDLLALGNLFVFTGYFLTSRRVREYLGAWEYVVGMTTVSGLVITTAAIAAGSDLGAPSGWDWVVLASLAIFPGTLGHVLTNWSHAHITAFAISMLFLATPVVASAAAYFFLGEPLTPLQIAGGAIVLGAIGATVVSAEPEVGQELAESAAGTDAP